MTRTLVWLILALPLVGVIFNGLLAHPLPERARKRAVAIVGVGVVFAAFVAALALFFQREALLAGQPFRDVHLFDWIGGRDETGVAWAWSPFYVPFAVRIDALSLVMILVVTGVGALIHLYSTGYMAEEARYARYFTYLNLFTFAMLLLVLANNYVLMFVGWEGVGLCSYLLIAFWFERHEPAQAGKKAFLVNRVGDWGFLLGMIALAWTAGSLTYSEVFSEQGLHQVAEAKWKFLGLAAPVAITLLLFIGATGKSAQLPLYLWLPDAMEGPTPVSALIHAATMVTAGVYMVARSAPLFALAPATQAVIAWVGIVTALFAALVAIVQYDIKRILAYSTVSQLGYMFVGVGVGAYAAGIAHLVTHAFFKALLFLAAGSVMHALHGELDLRRMGGLKRDLPWTYRTAAIGTGAIAGFPLLSGFYSKDHIIEGAFHHGYPIIGYLAIAVAAITAFYMTRFFLGIFAEPRRVDPHLHIHPETPSMVVPLLVLAALSIGGGWLVVGFDPMSEFRLDRFLAPLLAAGHAGAHAGEEATGGLAAPAVMGLSVAAFVVGAAAAAMLHARGVIARGWPEKAAWVQLLDRRFGYDDLLHAVFVRGGTALCVAVWHLVDVLLIDGLVNATQKVVYFFGDTFRTQQTGYVRYYAMVTLGGAVFVVAVTLWVVKTMGSP